MKSFITKLFIAGFGCALALAPLTASAAPFGVGISVGGPGYSVRAGYGGPCYRCRRPAPPPRYGYGWRHYGWGPAPAPALYNGYYGWAPGGYYGYYSRGHWFAHRRWGNGVWIYF